MCNLISAGHVTTYNKNVYFIYENKKDEKYKKGKKVLWKVWIINCMGVWYESSHEEIFLFALKERTNFGIDFVRFIEVIGFYKSLLYQ